MSAEQPPVAPPPTPAAPPSAQEQKAAIKKAFADTQFDNGKILDKQTYYLIDQRWWRKWTNYVNWEVSSIPSDVLPGTIQNEELVEDSNGDKVVKREKVEGFDYAFVPEPAWELLNSWYTSSVAIARKAVTLKRNYYRDETIIEVRLLRLKIIKSSDMQTTVETTFSKAATVGELHTAMCEQLKLDKENVRVWDFHGDQRLKLLDKHDKQLDEVQIIEGQKVLLEEKVDGKWPEVKSSRQEYNYGGGYGYGYHREPTDPGKTGLANLGNTCFMNSSLQCLSATVPLTNFLLSDKYKDEINEDNPLGTKGELTNAYAALLTDMWSKDSSVAEPRSFKFKLEHFAPQFSGYQQHDSQELLAFLLDGLHEDLNRVKKKPYVESVESDGKQEEEVARTAWEGHRKRNDSVIVDFFQGQLKSRLVCPQPDCQRISITFDPFMYLSLPLPMKNTRKIMVTFFWRDGSRNPVRYGVNVDKAVGSVLDMKKLLSPMTNLDPRRIALTELWQSRFHRQLRDDEGVDLISDRDIIAGYEVAIDEDFPPKEGAQDPPAAPVTPAAEQPGAGTESATAGADTAAGAGTPEQPKPLPAVVHLPVMIQHYERVFYGRRQYSGTGDPYILSVRPTVTYEELYSEMRKHTARLYVKEFPPLTREEKPKAEAEGAGEEDSDEDEDDKVKCRYNGVFDIFVTDPYGQMLKPLENTGQPLNLEDRTNIMMRFENSYREYYSEDKARKCEFHSSSKREDDEEATDASISLQDCLKLFSQEETLGPNDAWYCNKCKEHRLANKKFDLWKVPPILVIHLKRFSYRSRHNRDKLDTLVDFPLEGLDLTEYVKGPITPGQEPIYDLYAVSNHYGGMGGGHYTAYARHRSDRKWYSFDDRSVSAVSDPERVKTSAAYVLFYRRRDQNVFDVPFGTPAATPAATTEDKPADAVADDKKEEADKLADEVAKLSIGDATTTNNAAPERASGQDA